MNIPLQFCKITSNNTEVNCSGNNDFETEIRRCLLNLGEYAVLGGIGVAIFLLIVILFLLCTICWLSHRVRKLNKECSIFKKKEGVAESKRESAANDVVIGDVAKSTTGSVGGVVGGVADVAGVHVAAEDPGLVGFTAGDEDEDSKVNKVASKRKEVGGYETIDEDKFDAMVKARDNLSDNNNLQENHPLDVKVEISNEEPAIISKPDSPLGLDVPPTSSPPIFLADLGDYSTIGEVLAVGDNKHQLPTRNADLSIKTATVETSILESDPPGAESASSVHSTSPDQKPIQQQLPLYSVINKQHNKASQGGTCGSDLADYCTVGDVFLSAAENLNQECAPPPLPLHTAEMSILNSEEGGGDWEEAGTGDDRLPDAPPILVVETREV